MNLMTLLLESTILLVDYLCRICDLRHNKKCSETGRGFFSHKASAFVFSIGHVCVSVLVCVCLCVRVRVCVLLCIYVVPGLYVFVSAGV